MGEISAPYLKRNMSFSWLTCSLLLGTLCAGKRIYCRSRICNCWVFFCFFCPPRVGRPEADAFFFAVCVCVCMCFDPRTTLRLLADSTLLPDTNGFTCRNFPLLITALLSRVSLPPPSIRLSGTISHRLAKQKLPLYLSARRKKRAKVFVARFVTNTPPPHTHTYLLYPNLKLLRPGGRNRRQQLHQHPETL